METVYRTPEIPDCRTQEIPSEEDDHDKRWPLLTLKSIRIKNKLSRASLAEKLGLTVREYTQKENGVTEFMLDECILIAKIFGETLEVIFGESI